MRDALALRDAALSIVRTVGTVVDTCDGVRLWTYGNDRIRITYQPAIAGTSMPSWLDIRGTKPAKLFSMVWFGFAGGGRTEVLIYEPSDWEDALRRAVGIPQLTTMFAG